jgi:hypothetical protein
MKVVEGEKRKKEVAKGFGKKAEGTDIYASFHLRRTLFRFLG